MEDFWEGVNSTGAEAQDGDGLHTHFIKQNPQFLNLA